MKHQPMVITLKNHPLTHSALRREIDGWDTESEHILFFTSSFPWSNELFQPREWTYPEQIFPRLAQQIQRNKLRVYPGIEFPIDAEDFFSSNHFKQLIKGVMNNPDAVWAVLEESVIDLFSLCSWTDTCFLYLKENPFCNTFVHTKIKELEDSNSIKIRILPDDMRPEGPQIIASTDSLAKIEGDIESACKKGWGLIRSIREDAFRQREMPSEHLEELEACIHAVSNGIKSYIKTANQIIDQTWCREKYKYRLSALKEEASLLGSRFLASLDFLDD